MGQPKVTYNLMGQSFALSFESLHYSTLKQGWKPDIVEFTNPFNGKKTRNRRGWYYHAEIFYEAMRDADFLLLRDLFNKNTTNVVFYPNDVEVRKFPCDVQIVGLDFEDLWPDLERGITITFDSIDRYDSALDYPTNYWGCRTLRFVDDVIWTGHKDALNTADSNNLGSFNVRGANFGAHLAAANPHSLSYYNRTEVDSLLASRIKMSPIVLAGAIQAAGTWLSEAGGIQTTMQGGVSILQPGTITGLAVSYGGTSSAAAINVAVTRGDTISVYCKQTSVTPSVMTLYTYINGNMAASAVFNTSFPVNFVVHLALQIGG